jgi:hypothetical protein
MGAMDILERYRLVLENSYLCYGVCNEQWKAPHNLTASPRRKI